MSVEEIMASSDIKLLLLGDGKFTEIGNICMPTLPSMWSCPTHNTQNGAIPITEAATNKRKVTKTTCRDGRKPGSSIVTRQAIKSIHKTPAAHGVMSHLVTTYYTTKSRGKGGPPNHCVTTEMI